MRGDMMQSQFSRVRVSRTGRLLAAAAFAAVTVAINGTAARAEDSPGCTYATQLRALTGPAGADLRVTIAGATGCPEVAALKKLQVKTFAADGSLDAVRNLDDVPAPAGVANVELGEVGRNRRVEADVLVQASGPGRTFVTRGETTTRLRPDLVVARIRAPLQTLTTRPVDVVVDVSEVNGDTSARATVSLSWGPTPLGSKTVDVAAGATTSVAFDGVALTTAAPVELAVRVSEALPHETDATNNARSATVDVSEHELAASHILVPSLGGYGAQLNQHVFAPITNAPAASLPDLESKVKDLEPQLVRIFYNDNWEANADRLHPEWPANLDSFYRTVRLAHEAGATINITYQSIGRALGNPVAFMDRFGAVIEELVETRGYGNVRWVTLQNEPNSTGIPPESYERIYRVFAAELDDRGLRDHVRLMGGDLVANNQRLWFRYLAEHMNDLLDAYSVHVYWQYFDIPQMDLRLKDVYKIVTEELPPEARKPTYVTEFAVRGMTDFPGKPSVPRFNWWEDGTEMRKTNVAAFQQLWFDIVAAQLGYTGAIKWDAYWGLYDNSSLNNQVYWMTGTAAEGWPLYPTWHALRLLLQTTQRGWHVLRVDPWTEDDWKVLDAFGARLVDQPEKEIVAYSGPNGELTFAGLDTHARNLNVVSPDSPSYSIGGLPPSTTFNLALWNASGNGESSLAGTVTTSAAGVARFDVPLHAAFSLTTVPVA
jgi:hypothetical protein